MRGDNGTRSRCDLQAEDGSRLAPSSWKAIEPRGRTSTFVGELRQGLWLLAGLKGLRQRKNTCMMMFAAQAGFAGACLGAPEALVFGQVDGCHSGPQHPPTRSWPPARSACQHGSNAAEGKELFLQRAGSNGDLALPLPGGGLWRGAPDECMQSTGYLNKRSSS